MVWNVRPVPVRLLIDVQAQRPGSALVPALLHRITYLPMARAERCSEQTCWVGWVSLQNWHDPSADMASAFVGLLPGSATVCAAHQLELIVIVRQRHIHEAWI